MDWSELSQDEINAFIKSPERRGEAENYIVSQNLGLIRSVERDFSIEAVSMKT